MASRLFKLALSLLTVTSSAVWAAPTVGPATIQPGAIRVGVPTQVVVTALITDPSLLPTSVNLQRVSATGAVTVLPGLLHDDGINGDAIAGDKVFSVTTTFNESQEGAVVLRVSAAFKGVLKRLISSAASIAVISADALVTVGPEGGVLEVSDAGNLLNGFRLEIPTGALSETTAVWMRRIELPDPAAAHLVIPAVEFGPSGLTFLVPALLRVPYPDANDDGLLDGTESGETDFVIGTLSASNLVRWELASIQAIDTTANRVLVSMSHFSTLIGTLEASLFSRVPAGTIQYHVRNYPTHLPGFTKAVIDQQVREAFEAWGAAFDEFDSGVSIDAVGVSEESSLIDRTHSVIIEFVSSVAGGNARSTQLCESFSWSSLSCRGPKLVEISDTSDLGMLLEVEPDSQQESLRFLLMHELGHAWGLSHDIRLTPNMPVSWLLTLGCVGLNNYLVERLNYTAEELESTLDGCFTNPVMAPLISGLQTNLTLDSLDKARLRALYGRTHQATWAPSSPTGTPPSPRAMISTGYDQVNDRLIIFAGNNYGWLNNDVWVLKSATQPAPAWQQLLPTGQIPGTRETAAAAYDPAGNRLFVHGGWPGYQDTFVLENANGLGGTPRWRQLPSLTPPAACANGGLSAAQGAYDAANDRFIVFGGEFVTGYTYPCHPLVSETWVLEGAIGAAPKWTQLAPLGGVKPPPGSYQAIAYDSGSNRLIVHGGSGWFGYNPGPEIWVLEHANGLGGVPRWVKLTPVGSAAPSQRAAHMVGYDPATKRAVFVAGYNQALLKDVWILANADGTTGSPRWIPVSNAGPDFGGNDAAGFGCTTNLSKCVLALGGVGTGYRNDVWTVTFR